MRKLLFTLLFCLFSNLAFAQTWQRLYQQADSLMDKRLFKESIPFYEQALALAEKEFGKESENYLKTRNGLGRSMAYERKENTEAFLSETENLCQNFLGQKHLQYAFCLVNNGILYHRAGNYSKAEIVQKKALTIIEENVGKKNTDYVSLLSSLALSQRAMSNYLSAERLWKECLQIQSEILGKNSPDYAIYVSNLALLNKDMGDYATSEALFKEAIALKREFFGEEHLSYAQTLHYLSVLYRTMGNFSGSKKLVKEAIQIQSKVGGAKNLDYVGSLNNLAHLYRVEKNYSVADSLYSQTVQKAKDILGEKHHSYGGVLNNTANFYMLVGKYRLSEQFHKQSLQIKKETLGEKHSKYANSLANLADLYYCMGNYEEAEALNKQVLQILSEIVNEKHSEYIESVNDLANIYWQTKRPSEALKLKQKVKNWSIEQSLIQFSSLSESQKELFYNDRIGNYIKQFNAFVIERPEGLTAELYDTQLATKSILLQASQKMKNRILRSGDSVLLKKYEQWLVQKQLIIRAIEMEEKERKKEKINLDSLTIQAEELEKELSLKSESFASLADKKQITWKDIQQKLKKKEAAIEIVRVNKFGIQKVVTDTTDRAYFQNTISLKNGISEGEFPKYPLYDLTDTVYYAALIVKKKSKEPELVLLANGNDLEKKLFKIYRNSAIFKVEDKNSYQQYWQPIQEKLEGVKKVYFSPDGIYNQINLNILQNPASKKYLIDEMDIQQLTNTKEILAFQNQKTLQGFENLAKSKAVLFGRPAYDMDSLSYLVNLELAKENNQNYALRDIRDLRTGKFSDLLGTEKEINLIDSLLKNKKLSSKKFLFSQATENKIKALQSPNILHIATHGFFIPDSTSKNPMLNSGVLLAGVSNYYRAEEKPDTDDGILTAQEAQNLHLDQTDLVVLSACETGLGEIRNGEGVYGLQRAFKVAGAKSILMSHWKVDDKVTQELMTAFYSNWLKIGNKRKAFQEAQKEIRATYPKPYFWGAFVLVGE